MNLYIHVPFCKKKCNYCAFHSTCPDVIDWDGYVDGILGQLDEFGRITNFDPRITTLFFGGGTPSLMPVKYVEKIVGVTTPAPTPAFEFTLEANPKTLDANKLKDWKDLGLTRLSIGMQSFDERDLEFLGRGHTVRDSLELMAAADSLDLRVSADFIYGLPNQTVEDVRRLCKQINESGLKHVSLYELTIEPNTPLATAAPISEELAAEMYMAIQETLRLPRYEVSNYGEPCMHNSNIWAGEEYIGVGESAAGRICENGIWQETKIVNGQIVLNKLTNRERAVEMVMTGLRTRAGVNLDTLPADVINWEFINNNPGYFEPRTTSHEPRIRMTDSGIMLLDNLLQSVIT